MTDVDPYADAARAYLEAGWLAPIPLGGPGQRGAKAPVPKGFTGRAAKVPSDDQIRKWIKSCAANNLGLHFSAELGLVGIDVDHYGDKHGGTVLAELEAELGPLPPTVRSTARWPEDRVSGIRVYRLPEGQLTELKTTKIEGGIEIIQAKHRYAVAWPSVHPELGTTYEWITPGGRKLGRPPKLSAIPELPGEWVEHLLGVAASAAPGAALDVPELSTEQAREWLAEHGGGRPCRAVRGVLKKQIAALDAAAENGTSRYDTAVEGSWALLALATETHLGVREAVSEFGKHYRALVRDEPGRDASEWARMVTMGVAKAAAILDARVAEDEWAGEQHDDGACPERAGVAEGFWPSPAAPLDVAHRYVEGWWTREAPGASGALEPSVTLRRWRGQFYGWTGSVFAPVSDDVISAQLYAILKDAECWGAGETPSVLTWKPTPAKIKMVLGALIGVPGVLIDDDDEAADGRDGKVVLSNGVLDIGSRVLTAHTPARFALTELPFAWQPEGARKRLVDWLDFLASLWPDDRDGDVVELLGEWFGYVLSNRTDLQKALILIGPPRSGKGTIARVLTALVGDRFTASPALSGWGGQFGLAQFLGKSSATVTDADSSGKAAAAAIEDLKRIIGEDAVNVPRKYLSDWTGRLGVRFTLLANNVPAFLDTSGALARRFIPVRLTESFYGREDTLLGDKLTTAEALSAIFVWALDGLARLDSRGRFAVPESSKELSKAMLEGFSPVRSFLVDRARVDQKDQDLEIERGELYGAYRLWCAEQGRTPTALETFGRDLRSVLPRVMGNGNPVTRNGRRVRLYYGIELLPDAGIEEL